MIGRFVCSVLTANAESVDAGFEMPVDDHSPSTILILTNSMQQALMRKPAYGYGLGRLASASCNSSSLTGNESQRVLVVVGSPEIIRVGTDTSQVDLQCVVFPILQQREVR